MGQNKIEVLDAGYVILLKTMGSDLDVVNDARASFDKEVVTLGPKDERLINFLARRNETSPLRGCTLKFEVYAPLMVCRQWWKYHVAVSHKEAQDGWNETSRRYVTEIPFFYTPEKNEWRSTPENKKQGSGEPLPEETGQILTDWLRVMQAKGDWYYDEAMRLGVAPEQARLFLPAYGMYVRWRFTTSLEGIIWFMRQRLEEDKAQGEIVQYAKAVRQLVEPHFPVTVKAFLDDSIQSKV